MNNIINEQYVSVFLGQAILLLGGYIRGIRFSYSMIRALCGNFNGEVCIYLFWGRKGGRISVEEADIGEHPAPGDKPVPDKDVEGTALDKAKQ